MGAVMDRLRTASVSHRLATGRRRTERFIRSAYLRIVDRGWFGLRPLQSHVVICGFDRSGTSLLQAMVRSCVVDARSFPDETRALVAARRARRNHPFLVTKCPDDVLNVGAIRDQYSASRARPLFVIMVRDPRDLLTSRHPRDASTYNYDFDRFREHWGAVRRVCGDPDVVVVRYEDLVTDPDRVGARLAGAVGWTMDGPFSAYLDIARERGVTWGAFLDDAMGGARPPSGAAIGRWRDPEHRPRLVETERKVPELPAMLVQLGYEVSS